VRNSLTMSLRILRLPSFRRQIDLLDPLPLWGR
jgi:hypothetical protein